MGISLQILEKFAEEVESLGQADQEVVIYLPDAIFEQVLTQIQDKHRMMTGDYLSRSRQDEVRYRMQVHVRRLALLDKLVQSVNDSKIRAFEIIESAFNKKG